MDNVLNLFKSLSLSFDRRDDDWVDKLYRVWTVTILLAFSTIICISQYVGSPMICVIPSIIKNDAVPDYVNTWCWLKNTRYVPHNADLSERVNHSREEVSYYQWIPFIVLAQAACVFAPCFIWRFLCDQYGFNISTFMTQCNNIAERSDYNDDFLRKLAKTFSWIIDTKGHRSNFGNFGLRGKLVQAHTKISSVFRFCYCPLNAKHANFLFFCFLLTKILYLATAVGQLFFIDQFLSDNNQTSFVLSIFKYFKGNFEDHWQLTGRFPRITLCDFKVRYVANTNPHTLQCLLPLNVFNERFYVFYSFWLCFLIILSIFNLLSWLINMLFAINRKNFLRKYLFFHNIGSADTMDREFLKAYSTLDSIFILRMVYSNSSDLFTGQLIKAMYELKGCTIPTAPSFLKKPDSIPLRENQV